VVETEWVGRMEVLGEGAAVRLLRREAEALREEETVVEMVRVRDTVAVGVERKHLTALGMYV
jgi:hypothetical protein